MKKILALIYLCLPLLIGNAHAASFDCAKAGTKVEHMICDNPEISKLDEKLSSAYKEMLRQDDLQPEEVEGIKKSQRNWLKGRNSCGDVECLTRYYDGWLYVNTGRFDPNSVAFKYRMDVVSELKNICGMMLDRMNEEFIHERPACPYDLLSSIPGVTFPEWKKLDMEENKQLYKRFLLACLVKEEFYPKVFGGTTIELEAKRLPTKEQLSSYGLLLLSRIDPKWRQPKPDTRMAANDLERLWRNAVDSGSEFYRWDDALSPPYSSDVVLVELSRFDEVHQEPSCPEFRLLQFSSDLRMPSQLPLWDKKFAKWYINPVGIPFRFENQYLLLNLGNSSFNTMPTTISPISFSIAAKQSFGSCGIQRDLYQPY